MLKGNDIGLFGKLPAHGDFIYRDLPSQFINAWDAWLQNFVSSSQQQLGDAWLDIYLTSPIWRFVLSDGVVDGYHWSGILLPSVDRVGRYFPFSIVTRSPASANPFVLIAQQDWFETMETLALNALSGQIQLDELVVAMNQHPLPAGSDGTRYPAPPDRSGVLAQFSSESPVTPSCYPQLLDHYCKETFGNYSVWSTAAGSERINPCFFYARGLPGARGLSAMLDGQWLDWGWHQPCDILP